MFNDYVRRELGYKTDMPYNVSFGEANRQWDWGNGQWNWVPGHYERERVGHHWRERRWENRDGVYINVEGGWE